MYVIMRDVQTVYPREREKAIKNFLNLRYVALDTIITKDGGNRKGEWTMKGSSRFATAVLALFAAFVLVCGTWYLARTSSPEPYRVSTTRYPTGEDASSAQEAEAGQDGRPDSLLPDEVIDVNAAGAYDLQRLPGIGEKRALDIIAWREEHGPFQNVDELTNVPGIGPGILEGLREYVTVG